MLTLQCIVHFGSLGSNQTGLISVDTLLLIILRGLTGNTL